MPARRPTRSGTSPASSSRRGRTSPACGSHIPGRRDPGTSSPPSAPPSLLPSRSSSLLRPPRSLRGALRFRRLGLAHHFGLLLLRELREDQLPAHLDQVLQPLPVVLALPVEVVEIPVVVSRPL